MLPVGSLFPVEGEGEEVRLLWGTAVRTERLGVSVRLMALSLKKTIEGCPSHSRMGATLQHMQSSVLS